MKILFGTFLSLVATSLFAQRGTMPMPEPTQPQPVNPPIYNAPPAAQPHAGQPYVYEQKLMGGRAELVGQNEAQEIIERFKAAYPTLGNPRFLIYVNRDLIEDDGLRLSKQTEKIERKEVRNGGTNAASATSKTARESVYQQDKKSAPTLADRQTVRDVERLFGRPLRAGGAVLADPQIANQLLKKKSDALLGSDAAKADRELLSGIADVAIEILISSRSGTISTVSGDRAVTYPDIQATAILLKDARIIGQAASADFGGREKQFDVHTVSDAVALALMESIADGAK